MKSNDILFCTDKMKENHRKAMEIDYEIHRDLKVEIVPNGIIHPLEIPKGGKEESYNYGGVTDENLNFIELSLVSRDSAYSISKTEKLFAKMFIGANPNREFININYINEAVIYIGPMHRHIAHFYLECFSRWWYFLDAKNLKYKIAYMPMIGGLTGFHNEFFELMGINKKQLIEINKPIKFKSVIVPEQSLSLNLSYHKKYKELFDKISLNIKPLNYKKVYFSKTLSWHTSSISSSIIDKIYSKNGYKVLYPEMLSIKDTIAALKNCEEFVAQSGSNAHNAIFLSDNAKITILNRSAHFHPCQTMINKLRNLRVTYVDCFCEELPIDWSQGPFIFYCTNYFDKYCNFNNFKYNIKKNKEVNLIDLKKYFISWEYTYTQSNVKYCVDNLTLNKDSFINFVSFINKYLNNLLPESKTYFFGLVQKIVDDSRPSRTIWKICGKRIIRYKTSKFY